MPEKKEEQEKKLADALEGSALPDQIGTLPDGTPVFEYNPDPEIVDLFSDRMVRPDDLPKKK